MRRHASRSLDQSFRREPPIERSRHLFGVETEYLFSQIPYEAGPFPCRSNAHSLIGEVSRTVPSLPCLTTSGVWLANGSRVHIDRHQLEIGCCEVTDPGDALRYLLAGDLLLREVAARYSALYDVVISKCNVHYGTLLFSTPVAWGAHESYLHQADPDELRARLIPFLVSRIVFTGAGGIDPFHPGVRFVLSPRSRLVATVSSIQTMKARPIFHDKDEPLCVGPYRRLHVLGESTCSHLATWLKVGTTALVVALIEAGVDVGDLRIRSPVTVLHAFAADPTCRATCDTRQGPMTAIEIQRTYLRAAERHLGDHGMPSWATKVCERWATVLSLLERAPDSIATMLDWGIKHQLYTNFLRQNGFSPSVVTQHNRVICLLAHTIRPATSLKRGISLDKILLRLSRGRMPAVAHRLMLRYMESRRITWDSIREFLHVRDALAELETRFAQLSERGVFNALDHAGILEHRVDGIEGSAADLFAPPRDTRARFRGEEVLRWWRDGRQEIGCSWTCLLDRSTMRIFDLSDPFVTAPTWSPYHGEGIPGQRRDADIFATPPDDPPMSRAGPRVRRGSPRAAEQLGLFERDTEGDWAERGSSPVAFTHPRHGTTSAVTVGAA